VTRAVFALSIALFACGDVERNLITSPAEAGTPSGGASSGGTSSGGTSSGGTSSGGTGRTCTSSSDCTTDDALYCHPDRLRCVECVTDGHCAESAESCSSALGECAIPCVADEDCPERDDPLCDRVIGFCVECRDDTDCLAGECRSSECS
jgi:hypothetical protein